MAAAPPADPLARYGWPVRGDGDSAQPIDDPAAADPVHPATVATLGDRVDPLGLGHDARYGRRIWRRGNILLTLLLVVAHLSGALFVFSYLNFIAPDTEPLERHQIGRDAVATGTFVALAVLITGAWAKRVGFRTTRWLRQGRPPNRAERRGTLALPFRLAFRSFVPWVAAAVLFGSLHVLDGHGFPQVFLVVVTTLNGGLISATISYFAISAVLRPAMALALAGSAPSRRFLGVRARLVLAWLLGTGVFLVGIGSLPIARIGATVRTDIAWAVFALTVAAFTVGLLITVIAAGSVAHPVGTVRRALVRVKDGDLSVRVTVDAAGELGFLQAGVNTMVEGLRERQQLEDLFGRHVGTEVAQRALEQGTGLESEQRDASMLFVDLIGSTAMAEVLSPHEVVSTLNAFFGCVVRVVGEEGGWVNKFEGDGALCVFGAPATQPDHPARALRAARQLRVELLALRREHPGLDAGIGVSSGLVVAGNVGTETRYEYTVIGGPVNEAARLADVAKGRDARLLAATAAVERTDPDERARWADRGTVALRGKQAPTGVYEPTLATAPTVAG